MLMWRKECTHVAAIQVIWTGIPKERDHDGIDKLDDAVPVEQAYPLQGASDEVTVVRFALLQHLLYAPVFGSFTRRDATVSSTHRQRS
jgi:hypothetical protein